MDEKRKPNYLDLVKDLKNAAKEFHDAKRREKEVAPRLRDIQKEFNKVADEVDAARIRKYDAQSQLTSYLDNPLNFSKLSDDPWLKEV